MLDTAAVSYQVVLTKADKLNHYSLRSVKDATQAMISRHPAAFPAVIATSSEKGEGIGELRATIAQIVAERA